MIEARGLVKRYGSATAVDNLSFDVRPGTVTGFLGPNGAGKSTTMRMNSLTAVKPQSYALSPSLGLGMLCLYAVAALAVGSWALARRDA